MTCAGRDRLLLSLAPKDLVSQLAAQHQAAPCEYQILRALQSRLDSCVSKNNAYVDWKARAQSLVHVITLKQNSPVTILPFVSSSFKTRATLPGRDLDGEFYRTTEANDDPAGGTYIWMTTHTGRRVDQRCLGRLCASLFGMLGPPAI